MNALIFPLPTSPNPTYYVKIAYKSDLDALELQGRIQVYHRGRSYVVKKCNVTLIPYEEARALIPLSWGSCHPLHDIDHTLFKGHMQQITLLPHYPELFI